MIASLTNEHVSQLLKGAQKDSADIKTIIHLTAYENIISASARTFLSGSLYARYLLGHPDDRQGSFVNTIKGLLVNALPGITQLEIEACNAANRMFNATYTDCRPLSGVHAVICSLLSVTKPGDLVASIDPAFGGHFATKNILEKMGRRSVYLPWNTNDFGIDLSSLKATSSGIDCILLDHGVPLFPLDVAGVRDVIGAGTTIIYDGSHTLGLIASGYFQRPLDEGATILQGNTHKSFPGPPKAMIMTRNDNCASALRETLSATAVSNQHTHHSVALYVTLLEMAMYGPDYASQMLINANVLGEALVHADIPVYSVNGTFSRSHVLLIDTESINISPYAAATTLRESGFSTNARNVFGRDFIRVGTQEITRLGMKEDAVENIASLISDALLDRQDKVRIRSRVYELSTSVYTSVHYSFDK